MKKIKSFIMSKKNQIILILLGIFLMMLILNMFTPLIADDYSYSFKLNNERIVNLIDVFNYQLWHYFNWGGRVIAHAIAQTFLIFPKDVFNVFNSIVYTLVVYLIYLNVKGDNKKDKPLFLLAIHFCLWFLQPVFGQTCLWLVGSCNYLWTMFFILLFLWFFRKNSKKNSALKMILMFLFGIIAGWTNENTAFGLIVILVGIMLTDKYQKHIKILGYKISGLIGTILGFIILIVAPGNFVRESSMSDESSLMIKLLKRIIDDTISFVDYCLPLLIGIVILISIYIYKKKKYDLMSIVFLAGSILTVYAMVLSPTFPARAWFGVITFAIIAAMILLYQLVDLERIFKFIMGDVIVIASIIYVSSYLVGFNDIKELRNTWINRINYFDELKDKGIFDAEVEPYYAKGPHNPCYGGVDLNKNAEDWPNFNVAGYYGMDKITLKSE